ncbi:MAG: ABC transporter ATP-binding protein [Nitrospinae bacterium]|jgi:putative ABC transport system ATP-binding protein|nr:ABC transporter ATP-binding protein [Nitrospinota bacterium]MDA1109687.1 ABC transporter ATP-binding protein [Nitrospinota bacterium]
MSLIEMHSIGKTYKSGGLDVEVLKDVSLRIEEGEYISIIGPSGAGKSTLMTIMGCLGLPSRGLYILDGEEVEKVSDRELSRIRNEKIGFVFQAFHLLPGVKAIDNVMMPLLYSRKVPKDAKQRAQEVLEKVGLGHRLDHTPGQLSGGEQQRVTIARSLINRPKILLADEPTGNLDSKNGVEIMKTFDRLNREEGTTLILITHDQEVARHAHRIITIKDGQIESDQWNENFPKPQTGPARPGLE